MLFSQAKDWGVISWKWCFPVYASASSLCPGQSQGRGRGTQGQEEGPREGEEFPKATRLQLNSHPQSVSPWWRLPGFLPVCLITAMFLEEPAAGLLRIGKRYLSLRKNHFCFSPTTNMSRFEEQQDNFWPSVSLPSFLKPFSEPDSCSWLLGISLTQDWLKPSLSE